MKILNNYKEGNKNLCEIKHLSRTYFINLDKFQLFFFLQSSLNLFEYAGWLLIKGLKLKRKLLTIKMGFSVKF